MKTVEEFYKEIAGSKELQEELNAASEEMMKEFLKKNGCDADVKEFISFLRVQSEGEIEDVDAAIAAGGVPGVPSYLQVSPIVPHTPV